MLETKQKIIHVWLEPPFVLLSLLLELVAVAAGAADEVEAFEA